MSDWYRIPCRRPDAARRLVICPHAGGGPAYYRTWANETPDDIETVMIQLPGREARWKEKPLNRITPILEHLIRELSPLWDRPVILFGHSLGAIIAYELARRLPAERLIVTGARAPQSKRRRTSMAQLSDQELVAKLQRLGGTPAQVMENEELFQLFVPTLRADLEVMESYSHSIGPKIECPLTALGGFSDEWAPLNDLATWSEVTSAPVRIEARAGGHFFLTPDASLNRLLNDHNTESTCELSIVSLHASALEFDHLHGILDDAERDRAGRFLRTEHRDRFVLSHAALRQVLGRQLQIDPRDVRFQLSASGKPLLHPKHGSDVKFNLSHSGDLAVIVDTRGCEVGIDIEAIRNDVDDVGLSQRYFAQSEQASVAAASEQVHTRRFFAYWTAKEAYSKARGLGLNLPLDQYEIVLDSVDNAVGVRDFTLLGDHQPWWVSSINVCDGFAAAIASSSPHSSMTIREPKGTCSPSDWD